MFCTKCGNQIKDGYKFCPKCGTPAFVEKEKPKGEVNKEKVDEVAKETKTLSAVSEPVVKSTEKIKKTVKSNTASKPKKQETGSTLNDNCFPNPLIAEELDIEGVKKMAEKGNKVAMLRQAFRYEMGIGCDKDINKADALYDKVGGKGILMVLEQSHNNSILPDFLYDTAIPPTYDDNKAQRATIKVIPFVKDLILDYALKIDKDKTSGEYTKEKSEEYKKLFDKGLNELQLLFPEFFVSFVENKIKEERNCKLLERINSNAAKRYSLKWVPSMFDFIDYIDGRKIEIPSIYHVCSSGVFVLYYDSIEMKQNLITKFSICIMLQIPIKKIRLTFVDLSQDYDEGYLIKNLEGKIYGSRPITSEEQLDKLITHFESRRLEVLKKYGNYPEFCETNHIIPIPYELVFLLDNYYDDEYEYKIQLLKTYAYSIGVLLVELRQSNGIQYKRNEIYDRKRGITLSHILPKQNHLVINGLSVCSNEGDDPFSFDPHDNLYAGKYYDNFIEGYGEYEVVINRRVSSNTGGVPYHIDDEIATSPWILLRPEQYVSNSFLDNIVLTSCESFEEALNFIDSLCKKEGLPEIVKYKPNCISLCQCIKTRYFCGYFRLGLFIPNNLKPIIKSLDKDLQCYLRWLGVNPSISEYIEKCVTGEIQVERAKEWYSGEGYSHPAIFVSSQLGGERRTPNIIINGNSFDGLLFTFWEEPEFWDVKDFNVYVKNVELQIQKNAEKEWGKDYWKTHLCLSAEMMKISQEGYYVNVVKNKHYKTSILDYNKDNMIISDEFLQIFDFFNTEVSKVEKMTVQSLEYDSAAESKYETDLSTMIIPVGKAESKDADFRMDLVSHVHSFIIGQSGSGKSVFLHNIIGGAMLKYAPEDLQLYLLDFKLGGVEFNRYQGAKHVKALLVDNSDPQVTLEILRELRGSMTERGKLLRSAGVNNIGEYNKLHQQDRMPHVLVVADECHEMFKADDSIPRQVRNEISDIVIKIAKEGRSQGVHLVFATQTLSGTEISSEIINNVSDFYLLKCAQTDSERLVPNSSAITSELSTGQIYYHHVDEQVKFQAYYTDKEAAEKLMAAIVEKAKDHKSNGEFYFNGAQMFYLDESVKEQMLAVKGKSPLAFMGKAIDISQKDLFIKLNEDFSENVLLLGLNDQEQVTRTTMNLFVSLMMSAKLKHKDIAFKVIDCLNNEEGEVHELIFDLENEGYCEIIERRQRSKFFKELAQGVQDGTAEETILLILGQDRFRELKMDMELEESNSSQSSDDDMMSISDDLFGDSSSSSTSVRTYREALNVILDKGPDYGVHTLLQIEKASNLLFEDYITPKVVFQKFKHLVMLKSDETAGVTLHLNDDIRLEKLSSDWERLRAYYYAEESDSYTLFTPYMPSKSKDIINLLKTI